MTNSEQITCVQYDELQQGYDFLNRELFAGLLPDVLITLQRKSHSLGHFSANRFSPRSERFGKRDELSLNPSGFTGQTELQICSTLGHEMVHVWQHYFGQNNPKRAYHNKEWAQKIKLIGLQPSSTGMVGGKGTGQHMSDYVIPGGVFEQTYQKLAATGWKLHMESTRAPGPQERTRDDSKTPFTCPSCGQNAWGKPDLNVVCGECGQRLIVKEREGRLWIIRSTGGGVTSVRRLREFLVVVWVLLAVLVAAGITVALAFDLLVRR